MYCAHSSLTELKIWDWALGEYVQVNGKEVHSGNIEQVPTKEKAKFPQHFFPECKWSRKGFLRTRWVIRGTAVEFINIHLFHDASNLLACEPFPSVYCRSRRRALRHTLRHIHSDVNAAPYFIFGDFNFRTDTGGVVKKLTEELTACRIQNGDKVDSSKLQYRSKSDDRVVLTVGKKEFSHSEHQTVFREPWLQRFDRELEALRPHLYEFPVKFPPTYPFEEDAALPTDYMKTRCPSWCDRVLLSQAARLLIAGADRADRPDNRHLHNSRKSITDSSESSGRVSSSDSSPARAGSPAKTHQSSPQKLLEKKQSVSEVDALLVPGIAVSRKSIADPTAVHQAIQNRANESEGSPVRRKLVRNQSEGSGAVCGGGGGDVSAELRRLVDAPARRRAEYGMLGMAACTGDHKPIYLRVMLQSERGTVQCCPPNRPCALCAPHPPQTPNTPRHPLLSRLPTDPDLYSLKNTDVAISLEVFDDKLKRTNSLNEKFLVPYVEITSADYSSFDRIFVNEIDASLLSAKPSLDPYTPESIDSHTPNAEASTGSESNEIIDVLGPEIDIKTTKLTRDRSVSPTQLKTRLNELLNDDKKLERLNSRESCKSDASKKGGLCCLALKCYGFCKRKFKCECAGFKCTD
ncbi:hypothetical protein O0L34_g6420 [Tuta absoluta]|nr:hypothetical protein O0L34_g6420 [Tuta absoluta]